ncbi:hypothetical protein SAMN05444172_9085 [Burkholderia sp. GAS332]|nr:hypothetical protein SAMN05444172_9085 [Burkholderia sp. GAS332]
MTQARKRAVLTMKHVLSRMTPGERHSLHEIARRVKRSIPGVQEALAECVAKRTVGKALIGKRYVYWLLTLNEAGTDVRPEPPVRSQRELRGYDAGNRRFAELCMSARAPVQGQTVRYMAVGG